MKYLLLALLLTACVPAVVQTQPPVVIVTPAPVVVAAPRVIVPDPVPVIIPATLPTGPLVVLDASQVTVVLSGNTLSIALAPDVTGTWLRLTLPDGRESGITDNGACHCLGLGGASAHLVAVTFLPGLTVSTSSSLDGPWTVAAMTR